MRDLLIEASPLPELAEDATWALSARLFLSEFQEQVNLEHEWRELHFDNDEAGLPEPVPAAALDDVPMEDARLPELHLPGFDADLPQAPQAAAPHPPAILVAHAPPAAVAVDADAPSRKRRDGGNEQSDQRRRPRYG